MIRVGGRSALAAVALIAAGLGGCRTPATGLEVPRFDVGVVVLDDGAIDVSEKFDVRPGAGTFEFERRVQSPEVDALTFEWASMDGRALARDAAGDTRVVVSDGPTLSARWVFPPATGVATHALELRYRASGVVAVQGQHGRLRWPAIPERRSYGIGASRIALTLPPGAAVYEGSGIGEAGWTVTRRADGISAERASLSDRDGAWILAEFSVEGSRMTQPRWQLNTDLRSELLPAWISAGLMILVVGAGVLWIVRFQYGPRLGSGAEHREVVQALHRSGVVCVVLAVGTGLFVTPGLGRFGLWPLVVPASILAVGVMFLGGGRSRFPQN